MRNPALSVVMPLFNSARFVSQAVESVLLQTYQDFELLIVDDGSTDTSLRKLTEFDDDRIHVIEIGRRGLVSALNLGLSLARGEFLARMDSDDIARPDRFQVQLDRLQNEPNTGLVCSDVRIIDEDGSVTGQEVDSWVDASALRRGLLYQVPMKPIIHPSVLMRMSVAVNVGSYREFTGAEDRDFWLRALDHTRFVRINEKLLDYRMHSNGVSRTGGSGREVMSAMAAVNWIVFRETGVDMYENYPSIFAATKTELTELLEGKILPAGGHFRDVRQAMRERRYFRAILRYGQGVGRYGRLAALPDAVRASMAGMIAQSASAAIKRIRQV